MIHRAVSNSFPAHARPGAWLPWFVGLLLLLPLPAFAQVELEPQKESDWVDARWNRTETGNFQATMLPLPNGTVAKGLCIRLGESNAMAGVVYDTASCSWRAAWAGGFLKFDPARYGLIQPPGPAGELIALAPAGKASNIAQWQGLHVQGSRVILDYRIGGVNVKELPGYDQNGSVPVFTRQLEMAAGPALTLPLLAVKGGSLALTNLGRIHLATFSAGTNITVVAVAGVPAGLGSSGLAPTNQVDLQIEAANTARMIQIYIARCAPDALPKLLSHLRALPEPASLADWLKPGKPRWHSLETRGQRGLDIDAIAIDTVTVPYENPWRALFFTAGVDFFPNGDAAVCTIHGDVWRVRGLDDKLEHITWHRYATGLFQPLGLRVRDGKVFVLGRDQITRLHDLNEDHEADFYENFFNGIRTSTGGHDYVTSLELDQAGNFYYVDPAGVHRVSPDGVRHEILASGWRNPNGMGVRPDGKLITVAPQQGEWTPSSSICEVRPGGWYGFGGPRPGADRPLGFDPPLCWIPHRIDNSGGSQLWITGKGWEPLRDGFLHFSFGRCAQFLVLRDVMDDTAQGALVPLPGRFLSGAMRGAFNPRDGQLYVVGARGWQTSAVRDGCLQRARLTGKPLRVPTSFSVHTNGIKLTFSAELNADAATDPGSYAYAHWNYRYGPEYGSKNYQPSAPQTEGTETLTIRSARLLTDQRTVFLEIPNLRPVMQFEVKYSLKGKDGAPMRSEVYGTIHKPHAAF